MVSGARERPACFAFGVLRFALSSHDPGEVSNGEGGGGEGEREAGFEVFEEGEFDAQGLGLFGDDEVGDRAQEGEVAGEGGDDGQQVPGVDARVGGGGRVEAGHEEEDGGDVGDEVGEEQGDEREGEGLIEGDAGLDVGHGAAEEAVLLDVADDDEEADEQEDEIPIDEGEEFSGVLGAGDEDQTGGDQGGDFARDGREEEGGDEAGGDEEGFGDGPGTGGEGIFDF